MLGLLTEIKKAKGSLIFVTYITWLKWGPHCNWTLRVGQKYRYTNKTGETGSYGTDPLMGPSTH